MSETENLPVDWASQMAAMANAESKLEQPELGTFSFKAGIMSFAGTPVPGSRIDIVMLGTLFENRYFPEEFDENNIQSPLCWAFSEDGTNMAPNPALVTQSQSESCATCEQFQWGSNPKGRGGKACKAVRKFICIPATELENISGAHLGTGSISTTNVKYWSSFANSVSAQFKRPTWSVICTMFCQPDQKTIVRVGFENPRPISEDYFPALLEKRAKALEILSKPYDKRPDGWDAPKEPARRRKF